MKSPTSSHPLTKYALNTAESQKTRNYACDAIEQSLEQPFSMKRYQRFKKSEVNTAS